MAGLVKLWTGDFTTYRNLNINVPRGTFESFFVVYYGTNGTVGAANGNIGNHNARIFRCRIEEDGIEKSSFGNTMMYNANVRWFGAPYYTSLDGGVFELAWKIPASPDQVRMPNSWYSRSLGNLRLVFDAEPDVIAANVAAGSTMEIYAVPTDVSPKFMPIYRQTAESGFSASNQNPLPEYGLQNPREIFIMPLDITTPYAAIFNHAIAAAGYAISAHIVNVQITKDGRLFHNASSQATIAFANMEDRIELGDVGTVPDTAAATPQLFHITTYGSPHLEGGLGDNLKLELTTDATNAQALILYVGMEYYGDKALEGRSFVDSNIQATLSRAPKEKQANFIKSTGVARGLDHAQVQAVLKQAGH